MTAITDRVLEKLQSAEPATSQAQLARSIGMDPSALSRALSGQRGLSGAEIVALAQQLRVSTDWLLLGEEPFPALIAARHDYNVGGYSADLSEEANLAVAGVVTAYEQAGDLPEWPASPAVPGEPANARTMLAGEYGPGWQRNLADAVERTFGIDVVKLPLPGHAGVSLKLTNAVVIVVPVEAIWGRQNFTIAHELWHVAHGDFTPLHEGASSSGEANANAYAAELLMPAEQMRAVDWATVGEKTLAEWIWENGVSLSALRQRLSTLGLPLPPYDGTPLSLLRLHVPRQNVFHDPVTERRADSSKRRFPVRLLARHEELGTHLQTLSWMLGAPYDPDSSDEQRPANRASDLAALFGLTPA